MGEFINPIITECCKSCFCFDCLAVSLGELKTNKCPNCRKIINQKELHLISSTKVEKTPTNEKYDLKDKLDVLIDLILNKPDGRFMIFANYNETFSKIELKLKEYETEYHILKGQNSVIKKYIDDFTNKKVRILMLNATYFGAGMNLQMTTDLIMYHRFTNEMEEQIIGRAQRFGRKTQLNVYYLLHENESNNIEDKFKFEDQGLIHYSDFLENDKNTKLNMT
jgi:SNF2 family DNA or RNA helicase